MLSRHLCGVENFELPGLMGAKGAVVAADLFGGWARWRRRCGRGLRGLTERLGSQLLRFRILGLSSREFGGGLRVGGLLLCLAIKSFLLGLPLGLDPRLLGCLELQALALQRGLRSSDRGEQLLVLGVDGCGVGSPPRGGLELASLGSLASAVQNFDRVSGLAGLVSVLEGL